MALNRNNPTPPPKEKKNKKKNFAKGIPAISIKLQLKGNSIYGEGIHFEPLGFSIADPTMDPDSSDPSARQMGGSKYTIQIENQMPFLAGRSSMCIEYGLWPSFIEM